MLSGDTFQIEGKWISRKTGKIVVANNYASDGNDAIVMTNMGAIPMQQFMNEYVQYDESNKESLEETLPKTYESSNVRMSSTIFDQEYDLDGDIEIPNSTVVIQKSSADKSTDKPTENNDIVEKFFKKIPSIPAVDISMTWEDFPKNEIMTLVNFLDVNIDDISLYIYNNIFNKDNIINNLTNILKTKLKNDSE